MSPRSWAIAPQHARMYVLEFPPQQTPLLGWRALNQPRAPTMQEAQTVTSQAPGCVLPAQAGSLGAGFLFPSPTPPAAPVLPLF